MSRGAHIALMRFGKQADIMPMVPQIALPAIGGYLGKRYFGDIGGLAGSIGGGIGGLMARDQLMNNDPLQPSPSNHRTVPHPVLDTTDQNVPVWAQQLMQQQQKSASGEGLGDVVGGDMLGVGWPIAQGAARGDIKGGLRGALGQGAGIAAGGLAGHGAGHLLSHLIGKDVNVPLANIPMSTLLSGLGATIGSVKGLNWARGGK